MVTIRSASLEDITGLSDLSTQLGYACPAEKIQLFLKDLYQDPDHAVFVAESDQGNLAGYIHVFKTKRLFLEPFAELGGLGKGSEKHFSLQRKGGQKPRGVRKCE